MRWLVLLLALGAPGCFSAAEFTTCEADEHCPTGHVCVGGQCEVSDDAVDAADSGIIIDDLTLSNATTGRLYYPGETVTIVGTLRPQMMRDLHVVAKVIHVKGDIVFDRAGPRGGSGGGGGAAVALVTLQGGAGGGQSTAEAGSPGEVNNGALTPGAGGAGHTFYSPLIQGGIGGHTSLAPDGGDGASGYALEGCDAMRNNPVAGFPGGGGGGGRGGKERLGSTGRGGGGGSAGGHGGALIWLEAEEILVDKTISVRGQASGDDDCEAMVVPVACGLNQDCPPDAGHGGVGAVAGAGCAPGLGDAISGSGVGGRGGAGSGGTIVLKGRVTFGADAVLDVRGGADDNPGLIVLPDEFQGVVKQWPEGTCEGADR